MNFSTANKCRFIKSWWLWRTDVTSPTRTTSTTRSSSLSLSTKCCLTKMEINLYELSHQHSKIHLEPAAIQFFYEKGNSPYLVWYPVPSKLSHKFTFLCFSCKFMSRPVWRVWIQTFCMQTSHIFIHNYSLQIWCVKDFNLGVLNPGSSWNCQRPLDNKKKLHPRTSLLIKSVPTVVASLYFCCDKGSKKK